MKHKINLSFIEHYALMITFIIFLILAIGAIIYYFLQKRHKKTQLELQETLLTATTLNECITTLSKHQDTTVSLNLLLKMINNFFEGDRAYIFEINFKNQTVSNLYEQVCQGITPEKENLQDVPIESVSYWLNRFEENGSFVIDNVDTEVKKDTLTYELLKQQNISRLIAVPLSQNNKINGFLGVDNPKRRYQDLTLLKSVVFFIEDTIQKRNLIRQLEILSFEDKLTGIYNKNALIHTIDKIERLSLNSLAIIYFDLNGLKEVNDKQGHLAGDALLIDAATYINQAFVDHTYRFGGDEFIVVIQNTSKETILTSLSKLQVILEQNMISCSIGLSYRDSNINIEEQIKQADQDMYTNKSNYYQYKNNLRQNQTR